MRILFIGYSNVLRRRILPNIHEIHNLHNVDIAKYSLQDEITEGSNFNGEVFNSYEEALNKSKADIAYISTINSAHFMWAEKALKKGMHVIIDKPAFLSLENALELTELADKLNLAIAEATVYPFHPQIIKVNEIMGKENLSAINLTINFSFPPLNSENFRYKKELGGGALNDLGPYAVSAGRIFFKESPEKISCIITDYHLKSNVEIAFSVLAKYSNNRTMIGNFGFASEYINRLNIFGENFYFEINRVFTPPGEIENEFLMKTSNTLKTIKTPKSFCFNNFIEKFIDSIVHGDYSEFSSDLINDARSLELLKKSALNTN